MEPWLKCVLGIFFGGSLIIAIAWGILMLSGEPDQAEQIRDIPSQISEIKQNVTEELVDAGAEAIKESKEGIIPAFHQVGESMAKDIQDPGTKAIVSGGMTLAGFLLWLIVAIAIMGATLTALGIKIKGIN